MGTAKNFGTALKKAEKDEVFSKFDIQDAYKLMPAKPGDYRLQGFTWLGKYFIETRQSFGGVPSPCNFDRLNKTKDTVICLKSRTPRGAVFRALDDSPCVGPKDSDITSDFTRTMKEFCHSTNIPLAPNCPSADKTFEMKNRGIVLGVGFDSRNLTWFLAPSKAEKVMARCWRTIRSSHVNLEQLQQLMGSINDLAQMCPLLKFHKRAGNALIRQFAGDRNEVRMVTEELKKELAIVAKVAESSVKGLPIAASPSHPSLAAVICYTDAAGASFSMIRGERCCHDNEGRGVSCIIGETESEIQAWSRLSWPKNLLTEERDERGVFFWSKSTTLESVGLLLPMLAFPEKVVGRNLVFMIDNIAVMYGWLKGYVKNDSSASEVLKTAQYMAAFLGITVHLKHVAKMSDTLAQMADELSRKESGFSGKTARALVGKPFGEVRGRLLNWLTAPQNKNLTEILLKEAGERHPNFVFAN